MPSAYSRSLSVGETPAVSASNYASAMQGSKAVYKAKMAAPAATPGSYSAALSSGSGSSSGRKSSGYASHLAASPFNGMY